MSSIRISLNPRGVRYAALASPGVRAEIARRAEVMAEQTRSSVDEAENPVIVVNAGRSRARSYVRMLGADAALIEARDRVLGRAIDAGRH